MSNRIMSQRDIDLRDAKRRVYRTGRAAKAADFQHWKLNRKTERALRRLRDTHHRWEKAVIALEELLKDKS